jgi:hypothetical protein
MTPAEVIAARSRLPQEVKEERYLQWARIVVERAFAARDAYEVSIGVSWLYDLLLTDEDGPQLEVVLEHCGLSDLELAQLLRPPDENGVL